jgi:hypothetical protein
LEISVFGDSGGQKPIFFRRWEWRKRAVIAVKRLTGTFGFTSAMRAVTSLVETAAGGRALFFRSQLLEKMGVRKFLISN